MKDKTFEQIAKEEVKLEEKIINQEKSGYNKPMIKKTKENDSKDLNANDTIPKKINTYLKTKKPDQNLLVNIPHHKSQINYSRGFNPVINLSRHLFGTFRKINLHSENPKYPASIFYNNTLSRNFIPRKYHPFNNPLIKETLKASHNEASINNNYRNNRCYFCSDRNGCCHVNRH